MMHRYTEQRYITKHYTYISTSTFSNIFRFVTFSILKEECPFCCTHFIFILSRIAVQIVMILIKRTRNRHGLFS